MNVQNPSSRRKFLKASALLGGGLVVAFVIPGGRRLAMAQAPASQAGPLAPNAFLRIGSDDRITVLIAHSEMGQSIWTTLAMLIAEELDADWSTIAVEHAPAAPAYAHTVWGMQATGGSSTTWSEFDRYRQAGATARALLVQAAARRFGVSAADCRTQAGEVIAGNQRARYGELADAAARLDAPGEVALKPSSDWNIIGKRTRRLDSPEKVTGKATFGMDVQFDGLKTALVARSPFFGGQVASFDDTAARAVPGVRQVVQVPSGVAVVADHFWAAKLGRDALQVTWSPGPGEDLDTDTLRAEYVRLAGTDGLDATSAGDARGKLEGARNVVQAQYAVPFLAHAPMEPLNCTVKISADACEIWTGTQFQTLDQGAAARITGLTPEQVHIHTTFLGGGFGRRATPTSDFVSEAVHVAKAAGMPVKTVWTREDDIRGGYYRPMCVQRARIALGEDGLPVAWHQVVVGQSIMTGTPLEGAMVKNGVDSTSVEGVADSPYLKAMTDHRVGLHSPESPLPVLWWRSVGHSFNAFVMEGLVDELAAAAGQDPVAYRRRLLREHPRHLGVLNLAAEKAGWGSPLPEGRARGIAVHESFGSFVAQVAEVSLEAGKIRVHRVVCAIDCGIAVNPESITAQMDSGIAFGLSAALYDRLTLKQGRVQESNFHDYPVLRLDAMPVVDTHIVASSERPGGVGEVATPPIAPAVANALFALTGERLRELPLRPSAA